MSEGLFPRYDRNVLLFGSSGQERIINSHVTVVGVGGLGTIVTQQLALLGVGNITLIDHELFEETNRNRYVGLEQSDPVGLPKVVLVQKAIKRINPSIQVVSLNTNFVSRLAFDAIKNTEFVFGCVDHDGPRFVLNELCSAYEKPYFDLASEIVPDGAFGGRICTAWDGSGCIYCNRLLDLSEVSEFLESPFEKKLRREHYGVPETALRTAGPSVVSINGVVASLGVTEFMLSVTRIRRPINLINYRGHLGTVTKQTSPSSNEHPCFYCTAIRGKGKDANLDRYLSANIV